MAWHPGTEKTGHDVESALAGFSGFDRILRQPSMGTATESALFAFINGLGGQAMTRRRWGGGTGRRPCPSTLDLDEYEQCASTRDQVDFDAIGADVARDDAIPSLFEKLGGSSLSFVSQFLSWIRHGDRFSRVFALIGPAG